MTDDDVHNIKTSSLPPDMCKVNESIMSYNVTSPASNFENIVSRITVIRECDKFVIIM